MNEINDRLSIEDLMVSSKYDLYKKTKICNSDYVPLVNKDLIGHVEGDEDLNLYIKFSATGTQAAGIKSYSYTAWGYEDPVANLEYSLDGKNWTTWETGDPVEFGNGVDLYVRGMNPDGFSKIDTSDRTGRFNRVTFEYDEPTSVSGNIMGLINYETRVTEIPNGACFAGMFYECTSLTTAPELPATELTEYCYYSMFQDCSSLTTPPSLPATELAEYCYSYMFIDCTSLTTAPSLPATTLAGGCYSNMFRDCTSLNSITCLAIDTSAPDCLINWLSGVSETGTLICANGMKETWESLRDIHIPENWTINEE